MIQYMYGTSITIKDKHGELVKSNTIRDRNNYSTNSMVNYIVESDDILRPDIRVIKDYGSFDYIGAMIDGNNIDIFSFIKGEKLTMPLGSVIVG